MIVYNIIYIIIDTLILVAKFMIIVASRIILCDGLQGRDHALGEMVLYYRWECMALHNTFNSINVLYIIIIYIITIIITDRTLHIL